MYQNIFVDKKSWTVHLWDDVEGYKAFPYKRYAYCRKQGGKYKSLYGDELEKIFHFENNPQLFESDVAPEMRVLIDKYENSDDPSEGHKVVVIDIEVDSTGGFPDIEKGDKPITAIAIYDQVADYYYSFVLDPDGKIKNSVQNNSTTYSFVDEDTLLRAFLNKWDEIKPTILSGWNCIPLNQTVWTKNKIVKIGALNDNCLYDSNLLQKYPISVKEKWSIELENGKKIYSSGNHKFPVIMVNSNEYVTFNRSKNSNFIELDLTTKQIRSFGKDNSIFCAVQMRKNTNLDNPKYTMENLYLAGLIYTDGSIKDKKSLNGGYKFYQSDYEFMKKLDNFGIISEISGPIKNCYSRNIKREFIGNAHNLIYSDRNKKQMHLEELSTLSYKQFMMFLSGLLDGDGCKHKTTVGWCNFNGDIDTIHQLCNWNNIFCTERKNHLYFIDFNYKDLSLLKNKRWKNIKIKSLKRESKQKSSQIKYKRIKDTYWVKVKKVNYIGTSTRMMDIKTDTNYFITSGIKTHNCNGFDAP